MHNMSKKMVIIVLAVGMALFCAGSAGAVSLFFSPIDTETDLGSVFDIDIGISGLQTEDLSAFRFNINFDDAIISFDSYTLYEGLGDLDALNPIEALDYSDGDRGAGVINIGELSLLSNFSFQDNSFILATLTFNAIGVGKTDLSFSNIKLAYDSGDPIASAIGSGSVTVSAVPEPSTYLLLGLGLLGIAGLRKKFGNS